MTNFENIDGNNNEDLNFNSNENSNNYESEPYEASNEVLSNTNSLKNSASISNENSSNDETIYKVDYDISVVEDEINEINTELKSIQFSKAIKLGSHFNNSTILEQVDRVHEFNDDELYDLDGRELIKDLKINLGMKSVKFKNLYVFEI